MCCGDLESFGLSESRNCRLDRRTVPRNRKRLVGRVAGSVPRSREARQAAVIELCTGEESARVVAQKAGVSRPMLYKWKNQLLGREVPASMKRQKKPAPDHARAELEQQVESLRRDIRKLQLERDILKKANELVKKGMGIDPQLLSNREKTMILRKLRFFYALVLIALLRRSLAAAFVVFEVAMSVDKGLQRLNRRSGVSTECLRGTSVIRYDHERPRGALGGQGVIPGWYSRGAARILRAVRCGGGAAYREVDRPRASVRAGPVVQEACEPVGSARRALR